jgi:ribosome biogenesis GTPase
VKDLISPKLSNKLAHLDAEQLNSLIQRAKALRKRSGNRSDTFDQWIERAIRREERALEGATDQQDGIVTSAFSSEIEVETEVGIVRAHRMNHNLVVGDEVVTGMIGDQCSIVSVKPRRTKLSRPDVQDANVEKLIVANVDSVLIVVSVVSPPLHPRLIDRYLIAIQNGGARPLICVNKIDLLEDLTELKVLEPYRKIGIPVIQCSTRQSLGIDDLRNLVQGQNVVFVGHSGVGKSSLINAFAPELNLMTGGVSEGYGRGTHTTTVSSLHRLPNGTTLIDTPGIRSFGLWSVTQNEIERSFPEFAALECKFNDCTHTKEPGCGVLAAVASGAVSGDRYSTFLRLRDELG